MTETRGNFDHLVDEYDAARPGYPDEIYAAIGRLAGRSLAGAAVLDLGAGTGIATRGLLAAGARVVAADLGPGMLARARERTPGLPAVLATGNALPFRDDAFDLVCSAQAWHWLDPALAIPEAARVLRPGGALALWWNGEELAGVPWYEAMQRRLEELSPGYDRLYRTRPFDEQLRESGLFASVEEFWATWCRELPVDDYLVWTRSKSYVSAIGDREGEFLAALRADLAAAFPDGVVHEPFRTGLWVARVPG